jgi:hypothetical protein
MLLRPRDHRLDNVLRRPFRADGASRTPILGRMGSPLTVSSGSNWGFDEYIRLTILSNTQTIAPAEALYRPSHTTLFAQNAETGLQITEDKFITHDDTLVSLLSLRNAGEFAVPIEIEARWQIKKQEGMHRQGPPLDDLVQTLGPDSTTQLAFTLNINPDTDIAWKRAVYWHGTPSPVRQQQERWERWAETQCPRFDCPDSWFVRLWYHEATQYFEKPFTLPTEFPFTFDPQAGFLETDYDQPLWPPPPARAWVVAMLGLEISEESITLDPKVNWPYFCLDGIVLEDSEAILTIVWDDPNHSEDVYDDGDKGLSIYLNGRKKFHQEGLDKVTFDFTQTQIR